MIHGNKGATGTGKKKEKNSFISIPNFMKIYQAVQKLLDGETQTDRQTYW
jgi:hypothetical protein